MDTDMEAEMEAEAEMDTEADTEIMNNLSNEENFYRDGMSLKIDDPPKVYSTREGHVVEQYSSHGEKGFFVTLKGTHYCAHGKTLESAIADALWKDESKRPNMEALKIEIAKDIENRKITLNEFRYLTGACSEGCRIALKREKMSESPLVASEIRRIFPEWGAVLMEKLEGNG